MTSFSKLFAAIIIIAVTSAAVFAQRDSDSLQALTLQLIVTEETPVHNDIHPLSQIQGTYIYAGRKTEAIELSKMHVALTEKYGRQIFSKIPGVFVYDMDGTGNQLNIATRGLDPHRGWEFSIRKDGIITNSDLFGYPASHYNIPLEAVERIELVRGTGAIQYGMQFGGMLNFISKRPDTTKAVAFESINTVGSYGLFSTFNHLSGKTGRFRYSAWWQRRTSDGYRDNSESRSGAEAITLFYDANRNLTFKLEWTHSSYLTKIPGPLNDSLFQINPRMATRFRNYYSPTIHVPSLSVDWTLSSATRLQFTTSAVLGSRNSVIALPDGPATVADTINHSTLSYNNRQVDIDKFNSRSSELRLLHQYNLFGKMSALTTGFLYFNNDLNRLQRGKGTNGFDYDLTLVALGWGRDLNFKTNQVDFFAENSWRIAPRLAVNTGVRTVIGRSNLTGTTNYYPEDKLPNHILRRFVLWGTHAQYDLNSSTNVYAGLSKAYRPVILKDFVPQSVNELVDRNIRDAQGYNAEIGYRGSWRNLKWDVTGFVLTYNNRLGSFALIDSIDYLIVYRTNVGNSVTKGMEILLQSYFNLGGMMWLSPFTSTSIMDGRYTDATFRKNRENINVSGNRIESVPTLLTRNGLQLQRKQLSINFLHSYTAGTYADALNLKTPTASGSTGLVPAYHLFDINVGIRFNSTTQLTLNANNVFNKAYFTKRPQLYPGPGVWPSDGRTLSATVSVHI